MLIINSKLTPGLQCSVCQPLKEGTHVATDLCLWKKKMCGACHQRPHPGHRHMIEKVMGQHGEKLEEQTPSSAMGNN